MDTDSSNGVTKVISLRITEKDKEKIEWAILNPSARLLKLLYNVFNGSEECFNKFNNLI